MQTRYSDEKAVCLSIRLFVRLSVRPPIKRVDCDKTEERSVKILHHTKDSLAHFSEKKNFYLKFWVNWPPLERNRRF